MNLIERDGKLFSNLAGEYLKITLYSQEGEIKESITIDARDRSDTSKLDI